MREEGERRERGRVGRTDRRRERERGEREGLKFLMHYVQNWGNTVNTPQSVHRIPYLYAPVSTAWNSVLDEDARTATCTKISLHTCRAIGSEHTIHQM